MEGLKNKDIEANTSYITPNYENIVEGTEIVRNLWYPYEGKLDLQSHKNPIIFKVKAKTSWIFRSF